MREENRSVPIRSDADVGGAEFSAFVLEDAADNRALKSAFWVAVAFHLILVLITFPSLGGQPMMEEESDKKVFLVQSYRYKVPPPPPPPDIPEKRVERMPMPDPTPDDPEPLNLDDPPPEVELDLDTDVNLFAFPEAPPPLDEQVGPLVVAGEVIKPEKTYAPQPQYTEIARKARIQGVVIVQAIIDREGNVTNVKVLRGQPMGLSEEAVKAIKQWKFKPATLRGKPVDVYFNLTVNFKLQ
ncbi:MAG: energy transducer TonB [bacterium]|nr:energy transducer TonB [bacterium]